jgi:phosphoenolpyruvate carboxykinase (ATP)
MKIAYTRAMVHAALNGELDEVPTELDPIFGLPMPVACPAVPDEVLNPRNTWADKEAYDQKARELAGLFVKNFEQFLVIHDSFDMQAIRAAGPQV